MARISQELIQAITGNKGEIENLISQQPDWNIAKEKFNILFSRISNPQDSLWSDKTFKILKTVYFNQRESDKCSNNITIRTINGMPDNLKNDTKIIFLQIADCCRFFNASHKVNFESEELPDDYKEIKMIPAKNKGIFTFAERTPSLYGKISLTFDYWVPKILEWTEEIRDKDLKEWQGNSILEQESCTDFMRLSLLFLSETEKNPPMAKADDREKFLGLLGEEFTWLKKSAKREDIIGNNLKITSGLSDLGKKTGFDIPLESWSRILYAPFIKPLIKN